MKKLSMFFAAVAVMVAVAGAFASTRSARVQNPAWIDTSGSPTVCTLAVVDECEGGEQLCEREVNGNFEIIYEFDTTADCKFPLHME